jgi:hypothetical protein
LSWDGLLVAPASDMSRQIDRHRLGAPVEGWMTIGRSSRRGLAGIRRDRHGHADVLAAVAAVEPPVSLTAQGLAVSAHSAEPLVIWYTPPDGATQ